MTTLQEFEISAVDAECADRWEGVRAASLAAALEAARQRAGLMRWEEEGVVIAARDPRTGAVVRERLVFAEEE